MSVLKDIYDEIWSQLDTALAGDMDYISLSQKAFFPRSSNLLSPAQYPWLFTEFVAESTVDIFALPRHWKRNTTFAIVALALSSTVTDVDDLIYSDNANVKGILDIADDLKEVFWGDRKVQDFNVSGVLDWTIGRVGLPTVPMVQRILQSELIKGVQMDLVFTITERDTV